MIRITTTLVLACLLFDPASGQQEPQQPSTPQQPDQSKQAEGKQGTRSVAEWIQQLGSDTFKARLDAEQALRRLGSEALPALRKAAANDAEAEAQWRARRLIRQIERNETGGLGRRNRDDGDGTGQRGSWFTPLPGQDAGVQDRFDRLFADLERDFGLDIPRGRFFHDGFFRDLQQQAEEMRERMQQGFSGVGKGQSMSMQIGPDGVRVEIKQKGEDGKEEAKVYEAPDVETFQKKYPGVLQPNGLGGGMRLFLGDG